MLTILTGRKPAISALRKLDQGPRSEIEARVLKELCGRADNDNDTCVAWVKGHKGIKGNEEANNLCREASILGHKSEGVVTPAAFRAWNKIGKADTLGCHCHREEQSGKHIVEECRKLTEARKEVGEEDGGMVDPPFTRQKEGERGRGGGGGEGGGGGGGEVREFLLYST